jgi:putative transposase
MSLCDRYALSGDRTLRLPLEERQLMDTYAERYLSTLKPSMATLYANLKEEINTRNQARKASKKRPLVTPSRAAFERVIGKMDPMQVYAAREGEEAAKKKFFIVNGGLQVSRPLERVELDEWTIQLQSLLVDAGVWKTMTAEERKAIGTHRFKLVTAIDAYSRCILSARVVKEVSSAATIAVIAMGMSDKSAYALAAGCTAAWDQGTDAAWETACNDAGSAQIADDVRAVYLGLDIRHHITPAGVPQLRARKERFYRSIHEMLVALFEGRTFADIFEKGDYNGEARASTTADILGQAIVRWLVDVHHQRPHAGLGGRTPANVYRDGVQEHGILPGPDADQARALFGTTVKRRITNSGVRFLGLNYQSLELQKARRHVGQKPVLVRIDPDNLGHVSVRTKDGWLTVACKREGFEGVPVQRWVAAQAVLRRKYADEAKLTEDVVFAAMREIRAMADEAARRAGIASPILRGVDYDKFERLHFRTFDLDRAVDEAADIEDLLFDAEADTASASSDDDVASAAGPVSLDEDEFEDGFDDYGGSFFTKE